MEVHWSDCTLKFSTLPTQVDNILFIVLVFTVLLPNFYNYILLTKHIAFELRMKYTDLNRSMVSNNDWKQTD